MMNLRLRVAEENDCLLIWEWANDRTVRENAFNSEHILWKNHQLWYYKKLASSDSQLWILEYDGIPAAQIRYDRVDVNTAEISYSVAFDYRGQGLGTKILLFTMQLACEQLNVKFLRALVLSFNKASIAIFIKAGFQDIGQHQLLQGICHTFIWPQQKRELSKEL